MRLLLVVVSFCWLVCCVCSCLVVVVRFCLLLFVVVRCTAARDPKVFFCLFVALAGVVVSEVKTFERLHHPNIVELQAQKSQGFIVCEASRARLCN